MVTSAKMMDREGNSMTQRARLLVATHNPGKIREYQAILGDLPLDVTWLDAEGISFDAPETGATFAENAIQKATAYAQLTGLLTWADDSGLSVDGLDGRPGVLSARYGGPGLSDRDRYEMVLREVGHLPPSQWSAHFHCTVALVDPDGSMEVVSGQLDGCLVDEPRGEFGFGYDPIFFLPEFGVTLAELEPGVKNRVSHRAQAAQKARDLLAMRFPAN
jgi:XTP/dITP diphosphohydrolase